MVNVSKTEGGAQLPSTNLQRTVQSLKELTGNHSDTEVHDALKECNMDANEAAQKLLNQGLFHEVRRKRDKKKEIAGFKDFSDHRKRAENVNHSAKFYAADRNFNNVRRGSFSRNNMPEAVQPVLKSQEFRVVRDNRVNHKLDKEIKPSDNLGPASNNHSQVANVSEKSALGSSRNHKHSAQGYIPQNINRKTDPRPKFARDINLNGHRKEQTEEKKPAVSSSVSHPQTAKQGQSQLQSTSLPSGTCVEGVCASASDPVHVPSPNSRSPAIKREVGVVGGHRHFVESSSKQRSQQSSSNSNLVQGSSTTMGSLRSINSAPKKDPLSNSSVSQATPPNTSKAITSQLHASRQSQPPVGHQKGALPSKEWRPKSSQMAKASSPSVIGTPVKSAPLSSDNSKVQEADPAQLHEELSQVSIQQEQNVIIAQHIHVPEDDRFRLTFGSFGVDTTSSGDSASNQQATGVHESTTSGSVQISDSKQLNSLDDGVRNCGSSSPSGVATEQQIPDEEQAVSSLHMERYADTGLGRVSSPPFSASESQQHKDTSDLPTFAAYDRQTGYDISYFRHVDDTVREQTYPPPQETLTSHSANSIPASSMAMLQQQQQQNLAQMYPQVHVSHFANVMPYRQFLSPVYVPPMGLPGYSSNPTYAHPSNGSSYVLMPGGSSHLAPGNIKFGVQQFKPVPTVSAPGFGNFGSPTGYAINAPGIVGSTTGLEDSARLKYKDSNLYVPNPQGIVSQSSSFTLPHQAETSEVWIQNPREHPGMQSAPYYNMQGQASHHHHHHHPAYMQSHASFNPGGVAQSSHMQFPGVYHPSPNPHHMAAPMGGVGPGVPGAQVGAYQQQPQHGHINWTTNF